MTEEDLQKSVTHFLNICLPQEVWWTAINPLPGKRSPRQGKRIKDMGQRAGVPDLLFVHAGRALFVELKTDKGPVQPNQKACHDAIMDAGCPVRVCRSLNDVRLFLEDHKIEIRGTFI